MKISGILKKTVFFVLALILLSMLAACGGEELPGTPMPIITDGQSVYQIVRPASGGAKAAVELRSQIKEICGVELDLTTDFEAEKKGIVRKDYEIVIGRTNRSDYASVGTMKLDDYAIFVEGTRVFLVGGSETGELRAVEAFMKQFAKGNDLTVYEELNQIVPGEYPYTTFTLADVPAENYVIVAKDGGDNTSAKTIADALASAIGVKIPVERPTYKGDSPAIVIGNCGYKASADAPQGKYSSFVKNGDLYLANDPMLAPEDGLCNFFFELVGMNPDGTSAASTDICAMSAADLTADRQVDLDFNIMTDADMAKIDRLSDELRDGILSTASELKAAAGKKTYYPSAEGDDAKDGLTPETAWKTITRLSSASLASGDFVCFRRGDTFRGNFSAAAGVTYTSYGTGAKPRLLGSPCDGAVTGTWEETDTPNVYRYSERIAEDVGLIVFNDGEDYAIKIAALWDDTKPTMDYATGNVFTGGADLPGDLYFFHDLGGAVVSTNNKDYGYIYLRSDKGDPAERFKSIEFNKRTNILSVKGDNVTVDNLSFFYGGSHGVGAGTVTNLTVQNCEFGFIGGSLQNYDGGTPTRFGNAVEVYGSCHTYTVKHNYIHDVYDAGVTHQRKGDGVKEPFIMEDVLYENNLFVNCIYSIEYFNDQGDNDSNMMRNITIKDNIMRCAGGFGWQRPNRNARHIQGGWIGNNREYPAENFIIENNIFDRSCDVLLSCSAKEQAHLPILSGNTYIQTVGGNFGAVEVLYKVYRRFDSNVGILIRDTYGDADAEIYIIMDDVKTEYPEDFTVVEKNRAAGWEY